MALERLVIDVGALDRIDIRGPVPRHGVPGLYAEVDALVNDMRPGATDKVVYEAAASCLPVVASNPAFDGLLPRRASLRARGRRRARGGDPPAARDRPERGRALAAGSRRPRPLGRGLGRPRRRARSMSAPILHIAKVAGISGSENHLLLLLPALRERGHDVRLAMLHEDEPGAAELASRLREARRAGGRAAAAERHEPASCSRGSRASCGASAPDDRPHAPRPRGLPRPDRGGGWRGSRCARARSTASTRSATGASSRPQTARGLGSRDASHRDLRRARPVPRRARRASTRRASRSCTTGSSRARAAGRLPDAPRLAVVGRLIPIKGHATLLARRGRRPRAGFRS